MRYLKPFKESFENTTDQNSIRRAIQEIAHKDWDVNNNLLERMIIHPDGTVDISDGDIIIDDDGSLPNLKRLPIKFGVVAGAFHLWGCAGLTTLEGCPHTCDQFSIKGHEGIKSLVGCPKIIYTDFKCPNTHITSLEGGPEMVGGWYDIEDCKKITSLVGSPRQVGSMDISGTGVKNLIGSPEIIDYNLRIISDNVTSFEGLPKRIGNLTATSRKNNWIFDPRPFAGCQIDLISNFNHLPIIELIEIFNPSDNVPYMYLPMKVLKETIKNFIDSLDYNYIRGPVNKPVIDFFRFKEALDELDIKNPLGETTTMDYHDFVDEDGKVVDFYGNPI